MIGLRAFTCVVMVALAFSASSEGQAQDANTWPGLQSDAQLAPDFFPLMPWGQIRFRDADNGIESMAECGFTTAAFVKPEDLPLCEKLGLKAIMAAPPGQSATKAAWQARTDEQIEAYVREIIDSAGDSPAVIGYYIVDEPGVTLFPKLAKAVEAVRRHAPGKLAYINLFPGYATIGAPDRSQLGTESFTEYLERYVREVRPQFISYDNYLVQYSDDMLHDKTAAGYYRDLLEVRRVAMENKLPFWNIVSSNQIRPFTPPPSPANLALQAYTTLAAGGRGLSWYTYYGGGYGYGPVDKQGQRTETWAYLRTVNDQVAVLGPMVNALQSTGVFFTAPTPVETATVLPGRIVKNVQAATSVRRESEKDLPVMIGEFKSADGTDYIMVVNLSLARSINVKLDLQKPERTIEIISAVDGRKLPFDSEQGHWLVAGQGALMVVR